MIEEVEFEEVKDTSNTELFISEESAKDLARLAFEEGRSTINSVDENFTSSYFDDWWEKNK